MTEHELSRTLVKSAPELWAECSDAASLARHLDGFGEIRITRLEPEIAVAWEGERASGTVRLEPSGWGTRVVLTARAAAEDLAATGFEPEEDVMVVEAAAVLEPAEPEPVSAVPEPEIPEAEVVPGPPQPLERPARGGGLFARLRGRFAKPGAEAIPSPAQPQPQAPAPAIEQPAPPPPPAPQAVAPPSPAPQAVAPPPPAPQPQTATDPEQALAAALDSLGQAHHRPFSRK